MTADDGGSFSEAAAVGVLGAAMGAAVGAPFGLAVPLGLVAAVNGVVAGRRRIYDWNCSTGLVAFTLDSTWAAPMTAAGLIVNGVGTLTHGGYVDDLSRRSNRHVYQRGFMPRRGFAITVGNVISGAGDTTSSRRRRLVTDHEDVHVWQARWLGPLYPVLYGGWTVIAGGIGMLAWMTRHRTRPFSKVVETYGYYLNPFEWWAYSRDGHWPPAGKVAGIGWRRPMVRPFGTARHG